jgi:beta-lactamase regulating signal transducer with metallopeptidase domain/HEAT repeat protein
MLALVSSPFPTSAQAWLDLLFVVSLKATLVLAIAGLVSLLLARASAAARHLVWSVGLVGLLALPPLALWAPSIPVAGLNLPSPSRAISAHRVTLASAGAGESTPIGAEEEVSRGDESAPPAIAAGTSPLRSAPVARGGIDWTAAILGIWLVGAVLGIAWLLLGWWVLAMLSRDGEPVADPTLRALLDRCAREIHLRRPVALWTSARAPVPCTWGVLRPRVLVPDAALEWSVERLRVVLLHELAHVARRDCLVQTLAQIVCTLFWFHPLAWYGARRLRIERERACDDRVLQCDTEATDYADHLLAVVRAMRGHGLVAPGVVAFARPSQFEGRLLAVLDSRRVRGVLTATRARAAAILAALVVLPLALLRPWADPAAADLTIGDHRLSRPEMAAPSELVQVPAAAAGGLERRLSWATSRGVRQANGYWVAYAIPRVGLDHGYMSDNGSLDLRTFERKWTGPRMADVLAGRSRRDDAHADDGLLVLAYHFSSGRSGPEGVDRIRVQTMELPADFGRQPLYWLGQVEDAESFAWARRVEVAARIRKLGAHALEAVAVHADGNRVREHLRQVLAKDSSPELRAAAAEGLSRFSDSGTIRLLSATLHDDASQKVRQAAIEALGEMRSSESVDLLSRMARDPSEPAAIRRQAVEALGETASHEAMKSLEGLVDDTDEDTGVEVQASPAHERPSEVEHEADADDAREAVQRHAVESLGRYPSNLPKLVNLARTHRSVGVRRQAIEAIAEIGTDESLKALREFAWSEREEDSEVARQAVEGIEQFEGGTPLLIELARKHQLTAVRRQAIEALAQQPAQARVLDALDDILRDDHDEEVQRQAVESIAELPEIVSIPRLERIARSHRSVAVRRQAIEALGEMDPGKTAPILESLIKDK